MVNLYWMRKVLPGVPLAGVMIAMLVSSIAGPIPNDGGARLAVLEQRQVSMEKEAGDLCGDIKEMRGVIQRQNEENAVIKSKLDQLFYVASAIAMFGLAQVGNFIADWRSRSKRRTQDKGGE
jgi:hypothetical protein